MKKLLIGLLVAIVVLLLVGLFLPTEYSVERETTIQAPPAEVHEYVGDLRKWPEWAPWHEQDPSIETTYGDKTTGVGASQTWTSKDGDGELELTASDPESGIAYDFAFLMDEKRVPSTAVMSYEKQGDATVVTWTMEGDLADMMPPVVAGYMGLMVPGQIGSMFEDGLSNLKEKVEAEG